MMNCLLSNRIATTLLTLTFLIAGLARSSAQLEVTEFLAVTDPVFLDDDGDESGWIEITNTGASSASLSGLHLTNDAANLMMWTLPAESVSAGGSIVVWASGKDRSVPGADLHTNFTLNGAGGYLGLIAADGTTVVSEFTAYPEQFAGISYGQSGSGRSGNVTLVPWGGSGTYLVPPDGSLGTTWRSAPSSFDDSSWTAGTAAYGFGSVNGLQFETDLVRGSGITSCYFRFPFEINTGSETVVNMTVKAVIDDGFVAYLNGVEVASFNSPTSPSWNSTATGNAEGQLVSAPVTIDLSSVLENGSNVLAIQGMNAHQGSSDFILNTELTATLQDISSGLPPGYFASATPGLSNGATQVSQTISFDSIAAATFGDTPISLVASASSGLPVSFQVVSGNATVSGELLSITGVGDVTVRASQLGDSGFIPAVSVEQTFTVAQATQSITFPAIADRTVGDAPFDPGATATSGLVVTYSIISGPAVVNGAGLIEVTGAGVVTVQAKQAGNGDWLAAENGSQTFTVEKSMQVIDFPSLADRAFDAGAMDVIASSDSGLDVLIEVVSGPASLNGVSVSTTGTGVVTLRASQLGDDDFFAADPVERSFVSGYLLDLQPGAGGTILPTPAKAIYAEGEVVSLAVNEDAGFRFVGWSGALTGSASPSDLVMDSHQAVSAEFKRIWTVSVVPGENGSVSVDPVKAEYLDGDSVTFTPVPDEGYALDTWTGDAAGGVSPLTIVLSADTSIGAAFKDVADPVVQIFSPGDGVTNNQFTALFGTVSDNEVGSVVRWERDGEARGVLTTAGGAFSVTNLVLNPGDNVFTVFAVDPSGNESSDEATVTWEPERVLSLVSPPEAFEGKIISMPIMLDSNGAVGGMTFVLAYDPQFLESPEATISGAGQAVSQVNTDTPGEVRVTLALPATTLPAGELELGTVSFRARSVPFDLTTQFDVTVLDVSGSDGGQIEFGTHTSGAEGRIRQRRYTADINTNDRLDTGDAFLMQRLLAGFGEVRSWDNVLNDMNASGVLDSGDVVRVLRTVVGIDDQPGDGARSVRTRKSISASLGAQLVIDKNYGDTGETVTVRVMADAPGYAPSGVSFKLSYPVEALQLESASAHSAGSLVSDGALQLWNVEGDYANQSGSVAFVATSAEAWEGSESGGEIATFTFKIQAGASAQPLWEIGLERAEMPSADGFSMIAMSAEPAVFVGQPMTYEDWLDDNLDPGQLGDPLFANPESDPDGDGFTNLEEYATGGDPMLADRSAAPLVSLVSGDDAEFMAIEFSRALTAVDLVHRVETASDLRTWGVADDTNSVEISRDLDVETAIERITLRETEPIAGSGGSRRYLRVKYELLAPK